jgi:hypothetical protein
MNQMASTGMTQLASTAKGMLSLKNDIKFEGDNFQLAGKTSRNLMPLNYSINRINDFAGATTR